MTQINGKLFFLEHPEFFRISGDKVSLVWRRQYPKRYNVITSEIVEYGDWKNDPEKIISRKPLNPQETTTLIQVAINLHDRAIQEQQANRWWIPVIFSFVSAVIVALIAVFFKAG